MAGFYSQRAGRVRAFEPFGSSNDPNDPNDPNPRQKVRRKPSCSVRGA
jgi:hypothetical protein